MSSVPERSDDSGAGKHGNAEALYGEDRDPVLRSLGVTRIPEAEWVRQSAAYRKLCRFLLGLPAAEPKPPTPKPKRTRRPSPSKLAKWEAAWQAEQDAEAQS